MLSVNISNQMKLAFTIFIALVLTGVITIGTVTQSYFIGLTVVGVIGFGVFLCLKPYYHFVIFTVLIPIDSFLALDHYTSKYLKFGLIGLLLIYTILYIYFEKRTISQQLLITLSPLIILLLINIITSQSQITTTITNGAVIFVTLISVISYVLIKREYIESYLKILLYISCFVSLWAILQYISGFNPIFMSQEIKARWAEFGISSSTLNDEYKRVFGTFFSPNTLGVYLNTMIIIVFSFVINHFYTNKLSKPLIWISLLLNVTALYLTFSRTSWFSLILGVMIVLFIKNKRWFIRVCVGIVVIGILAMAIIPNEYWITKLRLEKGLGLRYYLWLAGWYIFGDMPLFGAGQGMFKEVYLNYIYIPSAHPFEHPHNMMLFILSEFGILAFLLFITFVLMYGSKLFSLLKQYKNQNKFNYVFTIALIGVFTVHLGSGLANKGTIIGWSSATFLFWILFALTFKLGRESYE